MVAEQQSEAPLVPAMEPHPVPPHTPLHSTAQQTEPSATPSRPLGHVEGVTAAGVKQTKFCRREGEGIEKQRPDKIGRATIQQ